jgi:hypothetical protein
MTTFMELKTETPSLLSIESGLATALTFDDVSFQYEVRNQQLLSNVYRPGQMQNIDSVLSAPPIGPRNKKANGNRDRALV